MLLKCQELVVDLDEVRLDSKEMLRIISVVF